MALIHFDKNSFETALAGSAPVLVDFWAPWCGPCRMLGPVIEQLAEDYAGKDVVIGKVDTDENPELAMRYGVMNIPTVLLIQNGEEKDRKVGAMPYEVYAELLDAVI